MGDADTIDSWKQVFYLIASARSQKNSLLFKEIPETINYLSIIVHFTALLYDTSISLIDYESIIIFVLFECFLYRQDTKSLTSWPKKSIQLID